MSDYITVFRTQWLDMLEMIGLFLLLVAFIYYGYSYFIKQPIKELKENWEYWIIRRRIKRQLGRMGKKK